MMKDRPVQVPVGTYKLRLKTTEIDNVVVKSGEKVVVDTKNLLGWIVVHNAEGVIRIIDASGKLIVGTMKDRPVQVPVGTYKLKLLTMEIDDVEVTAGEKVVIELE